MCGIAGILQRDRCRAAPRHDLSPAIEAMTETLAHRGPDAGGSWLDRAAGVALGHRRLAIVDASAAGHQPMISADGRFVVSCNGEIYNAAELRAELAARGHRFRGRSDTEAIVEGCAAWRVEGCIERLNGMFAMAVWDRETRRLSLVRDRLGIKPLYWAELPAVLLFGSELKALRAHPGWTSELDRDALVGYLRHGYFAAPGTVYRDVRKLEPGCLMTVGASGSPEIKRYWHLRGFAREAEPRAAGPGGRAAVDRLADLLRDAVARQMVADVPVGSFLSGGIDSSLVTALMRAAGGNPVRTFSIGFREAGHDEAGHARAVARHLGTDHTELYVDAREAQAVIPELPLCYDEPFADASQIASRLLAGVARRDVAVALSGDGGDEIFIGYRRYARTARLWRRLGWLAPAASRVAGAVAGLAPARGWNAFAANVDLATGRRRRVAMLRSLGSSAALYRQVVSLWQQPEALVPGAREGLGLPWDDSRAGGGKLIARMQLCDASSYLPDDILTKVDRATMAVGLEARVPLLDHRVVEFAQSLPIALHRRDGAGKWLSRQVLYRYVPRPLVDRPKQGFRVPLERWLRDALRPWAEALLEPARLARDGIFAPEPIRAAWARHLSGARDETPRLWSVLMFQAWLEQERGR